MIEFAKPFTPMGLKYSAVDLNGPVDEQTNEDLKTIISEAGASVAVETKEDGYRCIAHVNKDEVTLFTRSGSRYDERCFPDIVKTLTEMNLRKTILDMELRGIGNRYEGFKIVQERANGLIGRTVKGKTLDKRIALAQEKQLRLVAFDVVMISGKPIDELHLLHRTDLLDDIVAKGGKNITRAEQYIVNTPEQIIAFYKKTDSNEGEGIVIKQPGLSYLPGDDTHWIKVKRFESLDLTIVGIYQNEQTESRQALVATYVPTEEKYQTIGTVNLARKNPATGNTFAQDVHRKLRKNMRSVPPKNVDYGNCAPDSYLTPEKSIVLEIGAMEIQQSKNDYACGHNGKTAYSLRIGHVRSIREDKAPWQSTSTSKVAKLYLAKKLS